MIVLSQDRYDYVGVNQTNVNNVDTLKKVPLDSDQLWNNPIYDSSTNSAGEEIYSELQNPIYEDTPGPQVAGKLLESSPRFLANQNSDHVYDTTHTHQQTPASAHPSHSIDPEFSTYITSENPLYAQT